jgi:Tfp pilus assembly protein PilZ
MANVGQGLFMTPGAVQAQQQAPALTEDQMQQVLRGSFFNLGGGMGRGLTQAFGGDPRSPAEKQASVLQESMKQIDFNNPQTIVDTMNELNDKGFQAEAFKLMEALPAQTKPQKHIVDEWFKTSTVGDTTRKSLWQRDNLGFIHEVGPVSDTYVPATFAGFNQEWQRDVKFDTNQANTAVNRLKNLPSFKGFGPMSDTDDPEELKPMLGLIQKVANDLKDRDRQQIMQLPTSQANQLLEITPSDDQYLDKAYTMWLEGGGVEANIDRGFNMAGADVSLAPTTNTTDVDTLQARIESGEKQAAALAEVAARTGTLVRGDAESGQFNIENIPAQDAAAVFSRLDSKSDEDVMGELESMGYQFTPELFESHAKVWQIMREQPELTAAFMPYLANQDLFTARASEVLDQLEESQNFPVFASSSRILKYLSNISMSRREKAAVKDRKGRR